MRGITDTMREAEKVFQKAESGEVWNREVEELKDFDTHYAEEEKNNKSVDNENDVRDNEGEDRGNEPVRITNRITRYPDGHIDVKLKYPQKKGESRAVRIARRKAELREIVRDANGEAGERGVFVNALSDRSKNIIDTRIKNGESGKTIAQEYLVSYNKVLAHTNDGVHEARIIGQLLTLKGAEYYAGGYEGNIDTGRNHTNVDGRNVSGRMVQVDGRETQGRELNKHTSVSRLGKQGGFSNAKDKAYMNVVSKYQNAKTDAEKTAALETLQKMVNEAAKEAGFENAIPEQTRAYTVRTKAAPKKTQKVYKVFTVDDNGRPSALFVSSTDTLLQNVWLDANDTFNFTDQSNGRKYIPSTKNRTPRVERQERASNFPMYQKQTRQNLNA